ncbi:MAG: FkbM family methyltransferase [Reyranella sp.]|nr:FkbM family methyltransferase [Reyranella sp.]
MNLNYLLGAAFSRSLDTLLRSRFFPLTRRFPHGVSWMFDLQRYMGSRSLGVLFDVGANTGQTLRTLLRYAPGAEIYAFEPAADTFRRLEAGFKDRGNVHLFNAALGARAGQLALQLSEDSEFNTLVPREGTGAAGATQMTEVTTVDAVVAAHGISHLDLLKVDVQGWEMEVLHGARELIAGQNLVFVFAEVAFRSDETEMQQFGELHRHLESCGFVLCGFYDPVRYGPRREFVLFANALYVHPGARLKWTDMQAEWTQWLSAQKPRPGASA